MARPANIAWPALRSISTAVSAINLLADSIFLQSLSAVCWSLIKLKCTLGVSCESSPWMVDPLTHGQQRYKLQSGIPSVRSPGCIEECFSTSRVRWLKFPLRSSPLSYKHSEQRSFLSFYCYWTRCCRLVDPAKSLFWFGLLHHRACPVIYVLDTPAVQKRIPRTCSCVGVIDVGVPCNVAQCWWRSSSDGLRARLAQAGRRSKDIVKQRRTRGFWRRLTSTTIQVRKQCDTMSSCSRESADWTTKSD